MQAQAIRTDVQSMTVSQSLAAVETLVKAGLGCITFLRDLLPSDNFTDSYFTTSEDSLLSQSSDASNSSAFERNANRNTNGFKIMTMTRGYTDEGDKILNYLDGIFDAVRRQYLRSFIFAIYLDNKDSNNIVEAYTFNVHYHTIPGTRIKVPIMSIAEDLVKLSVDDPVAEAAKNGKPPTIRDVKKSVKALLKRLIHATTQMDVLPKRRYATFKVFYTDETPADYEPPCFQAGDSEKDKWFFMTHDLDEVPDKWSVGEVETGHHSINVSVTSIATYLPSSTDNDQTLFSGTTTRAAAAPSLTPVEEAGLRAEQAEKQIQDADARNIVWPVENAVDPEDLDAEGEDDPNYRRTANGTYVRVDTMVPVGIRNEAGDIDPIIIDVEETHFAGISQTVPTRLGEMNAKQQANNSDIEQTQSILGLTQEYELTPREDSSSSTYIDDAFDSTQREATLPLSDTESLMSPGTSLDGIDIDTQMLKNMVINNEAPMEDSEMLDMETQAVPSAESVDPIESFGQSNEEDGLEDMITTPKPTKKPGVQHVDVGLDCECGVPIEDETLFCEGGCGRWYHVWCMGYHSVKDTRIPMEFICFDCRARADLSWELIKVDLYPKMLSTFQDLALFRRAIKVAETYDPLTPADFAKLIGDYVTARQLFRRLEVEGFILEQITTHEFGMVQTRSRSVKGKGKAKGKQPRQRKNVQKPKYIFNRSCLITPEYSNYFNPDPKIENRLLGLPQSKASVKSRPVPPVVEKSALMPPPSPPAAFTPQYESQTQDDTQMDLSPLRPTPSLKRSLPFAVDDGPRPKKIKISMTPAVDLAE